MPYRRLISGSDLRGVAEGADAPFTPDAAAAAARAFVLWYAARAGREAASITLAVGHDPRLSSQALRRAAVAGALSAGAQVLDCGLCTTPAMFMATRMGPEADLSVMITASHLPPDRNGMKLITRAGGLSPEELGEVVDAMRPAALPATFKEGAESGASPRMFLPEYAAFLRGVIRARAEDDRPLEGMRVVLDASNGSGGFFAWDVLEPLGADITGSVNLEADGAFPGHTPNPIDPDAIAAASRAVLSAGAHLGLLFDADCDRLTVVDGEGRAIGRNRLVALAAALILKPGDVMVTDSLTSPGVTAFIEALGARHRRYRCGYKHVIDEAKRLNAEGQSCPVAIETSGHCALRDNHFLDDGAYLAALLLCEAARLNRAGRALYSLIEGLHEPIEAAERRYTLKGDAAGDTSPIDAVRARIMKDRAFAEDYTAEGVRFNHIDAHGKPDGWFILRKSVHDPVLVLNAESDVEGGAGAIIDAVENAMTIK